MLDGYARDDYNDGQVCPAGRHGRKLDECDFNAPTELYNDLTTLHEMLDFFQPLGRTMLVRTHAGGWFPPHKDNPQLTRSTFRIVAFLSRATQHDAYEWEMSGRKWPITLAKTWQTFENTPHIVGLTKYTPQLSKIRSENVMKLMSVTQNY